MIDVTKASEEWSRAVITVSRTGARGFVIELDGTRYVLTAGHCLPKLPPADAAYYNPGANLYECARSVGREADGVG